jgi:hypothetical protein
MRNLLLQFAYKYNNRQMMGGNYLYGQNERKIRGVVYTLEDRKR